jgi:integrase
MASGRLNARKVVTAGPGKHSDGGNLYLIVSKDGKKRWLFIFTIGGRRPEMTLGNFPDVSLAEARELAEAARRLVREGVNPIERRREIRGEGVAKPLFGDVARELWESKSPGWRNEKYSRQWLTQLEKHAATLWRLPVDEVGTDEVLAALKPIWMEKNETASRIRGYIETVLNAAKARGFRDGENPAAWRGHLALLLHRPPKAIKRHHAALHFEHVSDFLTKLRARQDKSQAAIALELLILTAVRTGEMLGASWNELNFKTKTWTIPADRMKGGREHRVPLSARAMQIVEQLFETKTNSFVFPSRRGEKPMSDISMWQIMRRMGVKDVTVHGFRSAFRDWCGEATDFPREIAEAALAHIVGDAAERAYRRGDALEKRRALMQAWADYIEPASDNRRRSNG